jgi:hypothetical protein
LRRDIGLKISPIDSSGLFAPPKGLCNVFWLGKSFPKIP